MIKGKLVFKTEEQAGKVCSLLNKIKDAEYDGRLFHFHRINKALVYEINEAKEQKELNRLLIKATEREIKMLPKIDKLTKKRIKP